MSTAGKERSKQRMKKARRSNEKCTCQEARDLACG
jgi:hypothetical protein